MADDEKRLLRLELNMEIIIRQNNKISQKLDDILPSVIDNSWWINRIKLGLCVLFVSGLGIGFINWMIKS